MGSEMCIRDSRDVYAFLDSTDRVIRPANYMAASPGKGHVVIEKDGVRWAIIAATAGLALLVAFRPRRKSLAQVAALAAALLIGLQLAAQHWFYLYIVWFFPLLMVALATISPEPAASPARSTWPGRRDRSRPPLPSPIRRLRRSRSEPASV